MHTRRTSESGETGRRRVEILRCPVDVLSRTQTIDLVDRAVYSGQSVQHGFVYAGKLAMMHQDPDLFDAVASSDIVNLESQPLIWLMGLGGARFPERVVGADLFEPLLALAYERGYKVFLFGATDDVLGEVVRRVSRQFSPELIAGYRNGYYEPEKEREIAEMIAASGAHILFVAMSSPKKEYFLCRHREVLAPVNFRMGVGGTFDVFAGKVKRAPAWVQRAGMEWLYRFTQEPRDKWKPVLVESLRFVYYLAAQEVRERTRGQ